MVYDIAFWAALILFGLGALHRMDAWVLRHVGVGDRSAPPGVRLAAAGRGVLGAIFSGRIAGLLKALVVDVLLQWRILRDSKDRLAWVMHVCVFYGFVLLLLFHALGSTFGRVISDNPYYSTLNPFLWLRDAAGAVLLVGLALAVIRRVRRRAVLRTGPADVFVLGLLATIVLSGFLLHAAKITSNATFDSMVADFAAGLPEEDVAALRAYWVRHYGLVTPAPVASHDPAVLGQGQAVHEGACQMCHDTPGAAVVSYPLSRAIAPVATGLDAAGAVSVLWYLHVLACCVGLGYLVFGKMFHVVSTPVSLLVAAASGAQQAAPVAATRQAIELDGCGHGGACHDGCPVLLRRLDRIGARQPFQPVLAYLRRKSAADLGSRPVAG